MPWNIVTARKVAGIADGDDTHDVALQVVMDAVLGQVESLLGRGLLLAREKISLRHIDSVYLRLPRYPILTVHEINGRPARDSDVLVNSRVGWIELLSSSLIGSCHGTVDVDYEGGYDPLPANLENALWGAFSLLWSQSDEDTGLPVSGAGTAILEGSGDVSKVVLPDGGSITFDVGVSAIGDNSVVSAAAQAKWGYLAPWSSVFALYMSESAPGVAFA